MDGREVDVDTKEPRDSYVPEKGRYGGGNGAVEKKEFDNTPDAIIVLLPFFDDHKIAAGQRGRNFVDKESWRIIWRTGVSIVYCT
mmetsp:Transcript_37138/g.86615  ORF Transcript_37138/g.86615 Transcript_37138/m.86615 type:complete len:85 (-) Transcript_37138:65-319(-)